MSDAYKEAGWLHCTRCGISYHPRYSAHYHATDTGISFKMSHSRRLIEAKAIVQSFTKSAHIIDDMSEKELDILNDFVQLITPEFIKRMEKFD